MLGKVIGIVCVLAGLASLGVFFVSCAGHPPDTGLGIAILPLSLIGGVTLFRLGVTLWRRPETTR